MKVSKRLISVLLAVLMVVSGLVVYGVTASAAGEKLAKYYVNNPKGQVGVQKTITIDGKADDWTEDMKIAQSGAWDIANNWKGGHENCVLDLTGLFACWDESNLYIGWQMVNTTDTWADREGDGPLSDGGRVLNVPLVVALSVDKSLPAMTGKVKNGNFIWQESSKGGITFDGTHVDHMFFMSGQPGQGEPAMFTAADKDGNVDYDTSCKLFKDIGVSYKVAETNICKEIWGLSGSKSPSDVYSDTANWVDFKTYNKGKRTHKISYDSFFEMSIPLKALGINASQIKSKGIGAMVIATRGESGIDCIPFDGNAMLDNAKKSYSKDSSTSAEKEDIDKISVPLAYIGKTSGSSSQEDEPPGGEGETEPDTETTTDESTEPTTTEPPTEPPTTLPSFQLGDVNRDKIISVKDATDIQKHLAKLIELDEEQLLLADYFSDGIVNIKDATKIQRVLAHLE